MRNRIVALTLLLVLLTPAVKLAADEEYLQTQPCDPNAVRCSVAFGGNRIDHVNSGCLMVCYVVLACWEGCSSGQPSWYQVEDRGSVATACPPAPSAGLPICI